MTIESFFSVIGVTISLITFGYMLGKDLNKRK